MFKSKQEIIVIQAESVKQIDSGVVFWSHDKGTAKLVFNLKKDEINQTLAEGTIVPVLLEFNSSTAENSRGRHIYHAVIEDAVNGIVSIVLEDNILGYQGHVDGSIYIELPDSRSLDTAGRFTFQIKRSPIDEDVPELENYYWQGFGEIMNQYHQTIAEIETESERLLNELQARILTLEEKLDNVELRARFKTAYSWSVDGTDRFTKVYPNENLLSQSNTIEKKWINPDGTIIDLANGFISEFLPVDVGETYTLTQVETNPTVGTVAVYDSNKQFISRPYANNGTVYKFSINVANAAFIRIAEKSSTGKLKEGIKLEHGNVQTIYTPAPSEDPINAYPSYKGISIVDSDNPADYSWQAEDNTIAKKATLDSHTENISNPHKVTKTQIGLGNVDNYSTATQAEAEAGTDNTKTMTPLGTAQQIDKRAVTIAGNQTVGGIKNFKDGVLLDDVPVFGITRNVVFDDAGVGGYFNAADKISLGAVGKIDKVVLVWSRVDDSAGTLLNYSWSQTVLFPDDIILGNSYRVQLTSENYKFITFKNESGILTISGASENNVAPNRIYRIKRIIAYIKN